MPGVIKIIVAFIFFSLFIKNSILYANWSGDKIEVVKVGRLDTLFETLFA